MIAHGDLADFVKYLTKRHVIKIHRKVLIPGEDPGILSQGNLVASVELPKLSIYGQRPHRNPYACAAALMHEICKLHPFVFGNKRTAYNAAYAFLDMNGKRLHASKEEAIALCIEMAACTVNIEQASKWIRKRSATKRQ